MTDVIGEMLNDTSKDMRYKRIFIYDIDPCEYNMYPMQEIEQIYTQYRQDVYRYLCSLTRDAALAEDLLSETFLRALTGLSGFRKGACVRTWLFSIARHVWIDGLRRKRHVLSGDELLARYVEEGGTGAPPFETQVDARALAARAKELLQTRRPPER